MLARRFIRELRVRTIMSGKDSVAWLQAEFEIGIFWFFAFICQSDVIIQLDKATIGAK